MRISIRKIVIAAFLSVCVLSVLFPPYAVMKMEGDKIAKHGSVGFHPFWNPPPKEFAYEFLEKKPFAEDATLGVENQLSSYHVIFNRVRFVMNTILLIGMAGVLWLVFRRKKSKEKKQKLEIKE